MTDPYLLLTPVLALAVLALARFVGCDDFFDLERVPDQPDPPDELRFVKSFTRLGLPRVNDFTGWVGMAIRVGDKPLTVTQLGRIMRTGTMVEHQVKLVLRAGTSGGADVPMGAVTIPPSAPIVPSGDELGFAYAPLQTAVQLMANTEYYVVSYETAMVADVFFDQDTIVDTGMTDVAQVTSAVFSTDTDPNDPMPPNVYEPPPIPTGNTYGPVDFIYEVPA